MDIQSILTNGKIDSAKLTVQSAKADIRYHNATVTLENKKFMKQVSGIPPGFSTIYNMSVDMTLDFISGIGYGQLFRLSFNPLGRESVFYVTEINHNINNTLAQTTIKGGVII